MSSAYSMFLMNVFSEYIHCKKNKQSKKSEFDVIFATELLIANFVYAPLDIPIIISGFWHPYG